MTNLVFTWLSTGHGGAEESTRILSESISSLGKVKVKVILWNTYKTPLVTYKSLPFLEVYYCNSYAEYTNSLDELLSQEPLNTCLFSNHRTFSIDSFYIEKYGVKSVLIFRALVIKNAFIRTISSTKKPILESISWDSIERNTINSFDAFIGVSEACSGSINKLYESKKNYSVYNAIEKKGCLQNQNQISVSDTVKKFLIVSRMVSWKSIHIGLEGFAIIVNKYKSLTLDIIGDGPEISELQQMTQRYNLSEYVKFHGWQSDPFIWYKSSDCLLHTSHQEAFGRVIAEANCCGLISIVPNGGGAKELVINNQTGFIFQENDPINIANAMENFILSSRQKRQEMAISAFFRAKQLFDPKIIAGKYISIAQDLITQNI
jgi:glycosyltransferase involved in cell wall biosynthesis